MARRVCKLDILMAFGITSLDSCVMRFQWRLKDICNEF